MSQRILHAVEIAAPADQAWRAFLDLADWPRWFPSLTAVARPASGPFTLGESLTLTLGLRGHAARVTVRVEEVAALRVRWVGRGFGVTGDHAFFAEALAPDRCRFVSDETFTGFPLRLLPRSVLAEVAAETERGLARFRALIEAPRAGAP